MMTFTSISVYWKFIDGAWISLSEKEVDAKNKVRFKQIIGKGKHFALMSQPNKSK